MKIKFSKTLLIVYTQNITKVSSQIYQDAQVNKFHTSEVDSKHRCIIRTSKISGTNPEEKATSLRGAKFKWNKQPYNHVNVQKGTKTWHNATLLSDMRRTCSRILDHKGLSWAIETLTIIFILPMQNTVFKTFPSLTLTHTNMTQGSLWTSMFSSISHVSHCNASNNQHCF